MALSNRSIDLPGTFSKLPVELFFSILDELVSTSDGRQPIAYAPSNVITKALRALTLVSRFAYLAASRYLYSRCLFIHNRTSYVRLQRTLGTDFENHSLAPSTRQRSRYERLFQQAACIPRYTTSMYFSPTGGSKDEKNLMVRLPEIIDLCKCIGANMRRLALDFQYVISSPDEFHSTVSHHRENSIFLYMPRLEELIISFDVLDHFRFPPPHLKRLAITAQGLTEVQEDFYRSIPSLETLIFLRPMELKATDIDRWMDSCMGHVLDIVLVDVSVNHATPVGTRDWKDDDTVRIWQVDVPNSFYGDDDDLMLCNDWVWSQAINGRLWTADKHRMTPWKDIEKRLAGPIHSIIDDHSF